MIIILNKKFKALLNFMFSFFISFHQPKMMQKAYLLPGKRTNARLMEE